MLKELNELGFNLIETFDGVGRYCVRIWPIGRNISDGTLIISADSLIGLDFDSVRQRLQKHFPEHFKKIKIIDVLLERHRSKLSAKRYGRLAQIL